MAATASIGRESSGERSTSYLSLGADVREKFTQDLPEGPGKEMVAAVRGNRHGINVIWGG